MSDSEPSSSSSATPPRLFERSPAEDPEEFKRWTSREELRFDELSEDFACNYPQDKPPKNCDRPSYAYFGSNGTTVAVNAHGNIIQISRYFGHGHSGFFCADAALYWEPNFPSHRMSELMECTDNPNRGLRLESGILSTGLRPTLGFVKDRWPRFTFQHSPNSTASASPSKSTDANEEEKGKHSELYVQYFCYQGTVFQQYVFNRPDPLPKQTKLWINTKALLRNLDPLDNSIFNFEWSQNRWMLGYQDRSVILIHEIKESEVVGIVPPEDGSPIPWAVGLTITPFIDGVAQKVRLEDDSWYVNPVEYLDSLPATARCFVTLAYRLQLLKQDPSWDTTIVPAKHLQVMREQLSAESISSFTRVHLSNDNHLDYVMRRNLEHILSVCSLPVPKNPTLGTCGIQTDATDFGDEISPTKPTILLTCGPLSGHQIESASSFFAFQFLLSVWHFLQDDSTEASQKMKERIESTCSFHLRWVFGVAQWPGDLVSPRYRANGQPMPGESRSLQDVPFQILKLYMFVDGLGHVRLDSPNWKDQLRDKIKHWVSRLNEEDIRRTCAYARDEKRHGDISYEGRRFYLVDHVWIYRALRSIENLDQEYGLENPLQDFAGLSQPFSSTFRQSILKRFTTDHPISKKKILASSRAPGETRYLFHSKDTSLFYEMHPSWETFNVEERPQRDGDRRKPKTRKATHFSQNISLKDTDDRWRKILEAQSQHEENYTAEWRQPLQYALALCMSFKQQRVNKSNPEETGKNAALRLLDVSFPNGLVPGLLDANQEPDYPQNDHGWQKYWHTTFEVPCALWMFGRKFLEKLDQVPKDQIRTQPGLNEGQNLQKYTPFTNFSSLIDKSGLIELSDDWLLKPPASLDFEDSRIFTTKDGKFCLDHSGTTNSNPGAGSNVDSDRTVNPNSATATDHDRDERSNSGPNATTNVERRSRFTKDSISLTEDEITRALVVDVRKGQNVDKGKEIDGVTLLTNSEFAEKFRQKRRVEDAKKRFIWMPRANTATAQICVLTCPPAEHDNLVAFFEKHYSYEKSFNDEPSSALNEWNTELHLSFYQKVPSHENYGHLIGGIPQQNVVTMPDQPDISLAQSVMSFRFVGDFFDRYWTCHFVEHIPARPHHDNGSLHSLHAHSLHPDHDYMNTFRNRLLGAGYNVLQNHNERRKHPWQQRKVLELVLFDLILFEIESNTHNILNWIRKKVLENDSHQQDGGNQENEAGNNKQKEATVRTDTQKHEEESDGNKSKVMHQSKDSPEDEQLQVISAEHDIRASKPFSPLALSLEEAVNLFKKGDSATYFSVIKRWRLYEQILQTIEEDLSENLERIEEWNRREQDRKSESPRWTRSDERAFRHIINKLLVQNQRKHRDLERLKNTIQTFRQSLSGRLESVREDMSFRGSENMSLFTYVTVVFLPLGFSTGIFSMSGPPNRVTLASMVIASVVAFSITAFTLVNANGLGEAIVKPMIGPAQSFGRLLIWLLLLVLISLRFVLLAIGHVFRPVTYLPQKFVIGPIQAYVWKDMYLQKYRKRVDGYFKSADGKGSSRSDEGASKSFARPAGEGEVSPRRNTTPSPRQLEDASLHSSVSF